MLTFLTPAALAGLAVLAVPVIIHLLRPRKVRVVPFSSLRWLRASKHRLTRRIQWHQILLFLLRVGLLISLVLALAKPVISLWGKAGPSDRVLVMEAGPAMDYRTADKPRPMEAARSAALALLGRSSSGRTALLIPGSEAGNEPALSSDAAPLLNRVRDLRSSSVESRLTDSLPLIPSLITPRRPGQVLDVYLFTANFSAAWSRSELARFLEEAAPPVRVHVVNAGPERPQNAWIREARLETAERPLRRAIVVSVASVGDAVKERTIRLTGLPGLPDMTRVVSPGAGRLAEAVFELPASLEPEGKVAQIALEPSDELPHDDRWWLPLAPRDALAVLVIEPETTRIPELQPGYHLRTALEALSGDKGGLLRLTLRTEQSVQTSDIRAAEVVFMADVPRLGDELLDALRTRVQQGGGLALFLGPSMDPDFLRTRLFEPLRPSSSLLPVAPGEIVNLRARGKLARLTAVQWDHPLLAGLFDPSYGDLLHTAVGSAFQMPVPPPEQGVVLAEIEGVGPAIIERRLGAGRVLLFNLTANDAWTDLPRRKSFVPLVDRTLDQLAGSLRRGMVEAGRALSLTLADADPDPAVSITGPDGAQRPVRLYEAGGRRVVETGATAEPGVYQVRYKSGGRDRRVPLVVQAGRRFSAVAPMDKEVLRAWWQPAEVEVLKPAEFIRRLDRGDGQAALDPWLMLLAFAFFVAEMIYAHRLCPRALPTVLSRSSIARDGFFKPGGEDKI